MKNIKLTLLLSILVSIIFSNANAQFSGSCIDSLSIQPTYSCPPDYKPVCGCDGKTYRSECVAKNRAGLNFYTEGSCSSFDFDITPNTTQFELNLQIYRRESGFVVVTIYNAQGYRESEFQRFIPGANSNGGYSFPLPIDVYNLESGIYLIAVISDGDQQVKKFLKYNRQ